MFIGMTMYDPHFGQAFYDGSCHRGFDHAEVLSRVECPAVLIHANWSYDDDGMLMGAMDADDASRANALMANSRLVRVDSGHTVHIENPSVFIDIIIDFGNELSIDGD
jgi:pimeloyl-ACP methyl ester carboxylesterase